MDVDFLTAALGAIVVAICAGPAVLAARGYRDARAGGLAAEVAVEQLRARRGGHAVAFGAVAVGGFLALTVCDIPALRDLGRGGSREPAAVRARHGGRAARHARMGGPAGWPAGSAHAS